MKKSSRCDHAGKPSDGDRKDRRWKGGSEGRWEFNLASEILFAVGSTEAVRRAAYRTAAGEMRFLPL
jgi:hypothetical protein